MLPFQASPARRRPRLSWVRRSGAVPRRHLLVRVSERARVSCVDVDAPSLTLWYPRHMLQYRIGLFFGAASVSGAFSGILGYGISFMSGTAGRSGWSWIFVRPTRVFLVEPRSDRRQILEGCATVCVGVLAAFGASVQSCRASPPCLTASTNSDGGLPRDRHVLDSGGEELRDVDEKYGIILPPRRPMAHHSVPEYETSSVGEEEHFEARHIVMAVTDWQLWLHILIAWSIVGPGKSRLLSRPSRRLIN
jgi:hypothetical protein